MALPISFAKLINSSSEHTVSFLICELILRICLTASTIFPVPASPLVLNKAAPSPILRKASPKSLAPQTKGILNFKFINMMLFVCRG